MANLTDNPIWESGIYQLEETDVVLGGSTGISNTQAKQLANRTAWLKNALRGFEDFTLLSSSKTLDINDVLQKHIIINGNDTSQTYNLPNDITAGTLVSFSTYNVTKQITINSQGTDDIITPGSFRQKLYLGDGEAVQLLWQGTHWILLNDDTNLQKIGLPFYGYSQKPNTLIANGQLINRADYPRLWEYIQSLSNSMVDDITWNNSPGYKGYFSAGNNATTFRIPDLRSMFIRGLDLGAGIDFGRNNEVPGGYEADEFKSHNHALYGQAGNKPAFGNGAGGWWPTNPNVDASKPGGTAFTGGTETRPKNIGLIPLIYV